jgi:hypothetical protein
MANAEVVGVVYPKHVGHGLFGDVFDRPEPPIVVLVRQRRRSRRLHNGRLRKARR